MNFTIDRASSMAERLSGIGTGLARDEATSPQGILEHILNFFTFGYLSRQRAEAYDAFAEALATSLYLASPDSASCKIPARLVVDFAGYTVTFTLPDDDPCELNPVIIDVSKDGKCIRSEVNRKMYCRSSTGLLIRRRAGLPHNAVVLTDRGHIDLRDANLMNANLHEADLRSADLSHTILRGACLRQANLFAANLEGIDLRWAILAEAELGNTDLKGVDLRGADLRDAKLGNTILRESNMSGIALDNANLSWADLRGANLSGADLSGANLRKADLTGADLTGAILTGADLTGAILTGADLTGADLTGAILTGVVPCAAIEVILSGPLAGGSLSQIHP
jgi:uncharacterized protein YjbI with pentapeptide repeats